MKTIRIKAAEFEGKPLPPEAEVVVLRQEIARLEQLDPGADVPFGRDSVCSREVLLGAYRRRLAVLAEVLPDDSSPDDLDVRLEIEDAHKVKEALSIGIVQLGEDGQPVVRADDLSTAALADAIKKAEVGSPALKRIREIIQEAKLTPEEAEKFMIEISKLAAMSRYANMPAEQYREAAAQARVNRLAERGFVTPINPGVGPVSQVYVPKPAEARKPSKLERKLQRGKKKT